MAQVLFFFSLDGLHFFKESISDRTCGMSGCSKRHNRLLHLVTQKTKTVQTEKPTVEDSTNSVALNSSVLLQLLQIRDINTGTKVSQQVSAKGIKRKIN